MDHNISIGYGSIQIDYLIENKIAGYVRFDYDKDNMPDALANYLNTIEVFTLYGTEKTIKFTPFRRVFEIDD